MALKSVGKRCKGSKGDVLQGCAAACNLFCTHGYIYWKFSIPFGRSIKNVAVLLTPDLTAKIAGVNYLLGLTSCQQLLPHYNTTEAYLRR